jgi:hypothetical protein
VVNEIPTVYIKWKHATYTIFVDNLMQFLWVDFTKLIYRQEEVNNLYKLVFESEGVVFYPFSLVQTH